MLATGRTWASLELGCLEVERFGRTRGHGTSPRWRVGGVELQPPTTYHLQKSFWNRCRGLRMGCQSCFLQASPFIPSEQAQMASWGPD